MSKKQSLTEIKEDALTHVDNGVQAAKQHNADKISDVANSSLYTDLQSLKQISDNDSGSDSKARDNINKLWKTENQICDNPDSATSKTFKKMKKELNRL